MTAASVADTTRAARAPAPAIQREADQDLQDPLQDPLLGAETGSPDGGPEDGRGGRPLVQMLEDSPITRGAMRAGVVQMKQEPGKTGGKVSLGDFSKSHGVDDATSTSAGRGVTDMNAMSLDDMRRHLGGPARNLGPRSTKEMLGAIASGVLPRWVARVGAKAGFDKGTFGNPGANQIFATEPSDVVGLGAAQALVKVGWTPAQLGGQVNKEIGLCLLDTQAIAGAGSGGAEAASGGSPSVREMNWKTIAEMAKDETANARFYKQLEHYSSKTARVVGKADLPEMFALAERTPVGALPDGVDPATLEKYQIFREALGSGMAASELFSGMGATISETGQLGAREVMVVNESSGFKLTPDNSIVESLGVLRQEDVDALMTA